MIGSLDLDYGKLKFLRQIAKETMKVYISVKKPENYKQSLQVARIAYLQALAMLEVEEDLQKLAEEHGILDK